MASSTITTKGQVTIPSALREKFRLEPGDKVLFLEKDGAITLMPMKQDITRLAGCLADDVGGRQASLRYSIRHSGGGHEGLGAEQGA